MPSPDISTTDLDYDLLDKLLDRTKSKVFIGSHSSFLGPLMCGMNFVWTEDIKTACTNGLLIQWNPHWFLEIGPEERVTVLLHELWHVAFLHMIRIGERVPIIWNYACDIVINNMLSREGRSFVGLDPWIDLEYDEDVGTEVIYDELIEESKSNLQELIDSIKGAWGTEDEQDIEESDLSDEDVYKVINSVVSAVTTAQLTGNGDAVPGSVQLVVKRFLQPKLPWYEILNMFMNELSEQDFKWNRPNRRYEDIYLPSLQADNGLEHLMYYLDVSGSITDAQVIRFNSEVKFIKDFFNPLKLTMVLFDTAIQETKSFTQDEPFEEITITGRGGTAWQPVKKHIEDNNPTAAIIFTDMGFDEANPSPLDKNIPVIWIIMNNKGHKPPFGRAAYINE